MSEFLNTYDTEALCIARMFELRWPSGFRWPKQVAKKIRECGTIRGIYKDVEENCRSCKPETCTTAEANINCGCWSAVVAGRALYLQKKCDYFLAGSIYLGSKRKEIAHRQQLVRAILAEYTCCKKALK
jgi:hypothetical protein